MSQLSQFFFYRKLRRFFTVNCEVFFTVNCEGFFTVNCEGLQKSQLSRVFSISASAHSLPFAPPGHQQMSDVWQKLVTIQNIAECAHHGWVSMDVKPNLQIGETSANNQTIRDWMASSVWNPKIRFLNTWKTLSQGECFSHPRPLC